MKKILKLDKFLNLFNKANKKNIKLNVEGKFNKKDKFTLKIKNLECDNKLAKELGFMQDVIDGEKIMIIDKTKKPTLRELMVSGFDNLNKRIDSIDKKIISIDKRLSNVEKRLYIIENTPTIKKELKALKK